jgi:hypothetical protein
MNLNFGPFIALETLLAVAVLALFIWRKMVSRNEDDNIHVLHGATAVPEQEALSHKLDVIDKWGKIMTVVTVVFGLLLAAAYTYNSFVKASNLGS